jgi:hypothetical protein
MKKENLKEQMLKVYAKKAVSEFMWENRDILNTKQRRLLFLTRIVAKGTTKKAMTESLRISKTNITFN